MNRKKELVIFFSKLSIGGMERALVEWLKNEKVRDEFNITFYLGYVKENKLLEEINSLVDLHIFCKGKWNLINKIITYIKMKLLILEYKLFGSKYDVSICYSHHHKILSHLTLQASKNNILFIHGDLKKSRTKDELEKLKNDLKILDYKKIVCVSNNTKKGFSEIYPEYKGELLVINNYINGEYILEKSKEKVEKFVFTRNVWFINCSRHDDRAKKISYLIEAANLLKNDKLNFKVLLVGDGPSHNEYRELIDNLELNDYVYMVGSQSNPYKFIKKSDCVIVTSKYEGYGLIFDEARTLGKPFITPDVGDSKLMTKDGYGILVDNSIEGIYQGMKQYLEKGFNTKKFDYDKFNKEVENRTLELLRKW